LGIRLNPIPVKTVLFIPIVNTLHYYYYYYYYHHHHYHYYK